MDINGSYTNSSIITWNVINNTISGSYDNDTGGGPGPGNNAPVISSPNPADTEIGVSVDLFNVTVSISDGDSDSMTWSIEVSTGDNNSGVDTDRTINCTLTTPLEYNTTYTWWVNVTDGEDDANSIFTFTTVTTLVISDDVNGLYVNTTNRIVLSDEFPGNGSYIQSFQPTVYFTLTNPLGRVMNYTIYIGNSSVNTSTVLDSGVNVSNGTYYYNNYYTASNYTSYWWRVYVNDSVYVLNESFVFTITRGGGGLVSTGGSAFAIATAGVMIGIIALVFVFAKKKKRWQ